MEEELFQPKGKTFYTAGGFWFVSVILSVFIVFGLVMVVVCLWRILSNSFENSFEAAFCAFLLLFGIFSSVYFIRLFFVMVWPQRAFFITIDRSGVSSNGVKTLETTDVNSCTDCEYRTFAWTDIEKIGCTSFPKTGPFYMIIFTKNAEIFTVCLQQFFRWKSIEKEIEQFMPCTDFGNHDVFLKEQQ
jgi:hypothetical protein